MIDSERVTYNEYVKKLAQLGHHDFTEELYRNCLGKNKPESVRYLLTIMVKTFL